MFKVRSNPISSDMRTYEKYRDIPATGSGREVGTAYEATVWPGFAYATVPCTLKESDDPESVLAVGIAANHPSDPEESEQILGDLIVPYTDAIMNEISACEWPEEWEGAR
ncbi:hypothetical protein [Streptomyces sp. SM12]|uniref:hypothetical protein n=1 Tax=Streptomyces sp. SM12 TaxID=1071602 RepID=UPI000CD4D783|nr:hypothetical protein [Streptomyces sp. SM12]